MEASGQKVVWNLEDLRAPQMCLTVSQYKYFVKSALK